MKCNNYIAIIKIVIIILFIYLLSYYLLSIKKEGFTTETNISSKKIAIITAIYGKYEILKNYSNVFNYERADWYCFTDGDIENNDFPWKIIKTPYHLNIDDSSLKNSYSNINDEKVKNMMSAKYYKTQTHKIDILKDYDYFIWIDGSLLLRDNFLNNVINLLENNSDYSIFNFKHSVRDNIKDEVYFCKDWQKYKDQDLETQYLTYKNDNFKDDWGLYELTSFYRKNIPEINKIYDLWWYHNLCYSYQDQVSYPYVLWKLNTKPYIIKENVHNNDDFCYNKEHAIKW